MESGNGRQTKFGFILAGKVYFDKSANMNFCRANTLNESANRNDLDENHIFKTK